MGKIIVDALREAGIDPMKAASNQMICSLVGSWGRAEMTRDEFLHCCRNMAILNPSLKVG